MNCQDVTDRLWAYFEGVLTDSERAGFESHAGGCAVCGPLLVKCREITCREVTEFLDDYVEDRLSPERRRIFDRHMSVCPDCVRYLDGYRKTLALGREAAEPQPDELPPDLLRGLLDAMNDGEAG